MGDRPRCGHCGEIVGVYESARLLLPDGSEQHGSVLTLGEQLKARGATVVHERCYEGLARAPRHGRPRTEA